MLLASLKKTLNILDRRPLFQLSGIILFTFIISILETVGIGFIAIFVSLLGDVEVVVSKIPNFLFKEEIQKLEKEDIISLFLVLLITFFFVKNFLIFIFSYILNKFKIKIELSVVTKLLNKYLNHDYEFFLKNSSSKLINNITEETTRFTSFLFCILNILKESILAISIIGSIIYVNWNTSLIIFIFIILFSLAIYKILKNIFKSLGEKRTSFSINLLKNIYETIGGIKLIKLNKLENYSLLKIVSINKKLLHVNLISTILSPIPRLLLEVIAISGISLTIFIFFQQNYIYEEILPIITFLSLAIIRMVPAISAINQNINSLLANLISVEIISQEFDVKNENDDNKVNNETDVSKKKLDIAINSIELKKVNFKYFGSKENVLSDVNLKFKKNEIIGIIGKSGCGKSTLADILLGLLKPSSGDTIINANTKNDFNPFVDKIGYVPQINYITDDNLEKNISFGIEEEKVDSEKIKKAIEFSQLKELSDTHKNRPLGDSGVKISGGQKQRIGIARAIYKNPQLIIFDEATSALDIHTEEKIINKINKFKKDKIIVIIAHRLSSLNICDKLLILEEGKVLEYGKKEDIVKKNLYLEKYIQSNKEL